jgi:hypothetical protein
VRDMDNSEVDYVARKLHEHCLRELQAELPLLATLSPGWQDYLPQARVALAAAAEWNARHGVSH